MHKSETSELPCLGGEVIMMHLNSSKCFTRRGFARRVLVGLPALALGLGARPSNAQEGFREGRTGEIPEGAADLVDPRTLKAVNEGLEWLAGHQAPDGSYGNASYRAAITSLAGIGFLANGSSPGRGPYGFAIEQAIDYVLDCCDASGFVSSPPPSNNPMYGHGFATLFLAEAYGMSKRPELRSALDRAVRLIIDTQNEDGGWRYQPVRDDADISVTVCQINALRAARNAGIFVPAETVTRCIDYVKQAQNPDGGFRYQLPNGSSAFPRSAAGLVALYSASVFNDESIEAAVDYVKQHRPDDRFLRRLPHYYYGHYYAAQAMWIRGGNDWNSWYPAIRDELLREQDGDGSWSDGFGAAYGTAMALIILQIPLGCLPIFQR